MPLSPFQSCSLTGSRLSFMRWQSSRRNAARCFRKWIAWAQVVCPPGPLLPVVRAHPESNYGRMSKFRPRSYLTPRLVFASFTIFLLFSLEAAPPTFSFPLSSPRVPVLRRDSHLSVSLLPPYRPLPLSSSSLRIVFFLAILVWAVVRKYRDWVVHPVAALRRQQRSSRGPYTPPSSSCAWSSKPCRPPSLCSNEHSRFRV